MNIAGKVAELAGNVAVVEQTVTDTLAVEHTAAEDTVVLVVESCDAVP